ncbi:MAG: ImmA/IrrE family metallo-endopeptidase [Lachnospiraceae bacterium]|nr:ImmA/IrrE family metallo-endopeptidase [Lachnospiraceae bacterium]
MRAYKIISLVNQIKVCLQTNDPYEIAAHYGIEVLHRDIDIKGFKAQTIKFEGYPTVISINQAYAEISRKVLCAHELGHALLHEGVINHFDVTQKNINSSVEYEANLFAVALLTEEEDFNIPREKLDSTMLKKIMDMNVYKEEVFTP